MNSQIKYSANAHPDVVELDRLHAGLLDDDLETRDAMLAHAQSCATCRGHLALWSRTTEMLDAITERNLASRLSVRRHRALRGRPTTVKSHRPMMLALAAAVATLAIGLSVLIYTQEETADPAAVVANAQSSDLYTDLDFYLWLSEKQTSEDGSPNS